jgi:hypothetical protein
MKDIGGVELPDTLINLTGGKPETAENGDAHPVRPGMEGKNR